MYDYNNKSKGKQVQEAVPAWSQNRLLPATTQGKWHKSLPVPLQLVRAPAQGLAQKGGGEGAVRSQRPGNS